MKKIIIFGANSYIARNFIHFLKNQEVELELYGHGENHADNEKKYKQINLLDINQLATINLGCDYIYIFSGKTGTNIGFENYKEFLEVNELGLLNLINEYIRQSSNAKIIFPSTRLIYKGKNHALKEDDEKEFKTIYAINKFSCENYLSMYSNIYGLRYNIVRICVPYGTMIQGASSYGTIEFLLSKAKLNANITLYGSGSQRRSITDIRDLCRLLYKVAELGHDNEVYNIGGEDYSLKEMAELIARKFSVTVDSVPFTEKALKLESGSTVFDDSKLQSVLGKKLYNYSFDDWVMGLKI